MKLEEIDQLWQEDCQLKLSRLQEEGANIAVIHNKYLCILFHEKSVLHDLKLQQRQLVRKLNETYTNPTKGDRHRLPPTGKVLKDSLKLYIESDVDFLEIERKILDQEDKIDYLKEVLKIISQRTFVIKNIIEQRKLESGG